MRPRPARVEILGVGVSAIDMPIAVEAILDAAASKTKGYVCVTGVHGIMEAQKDPELRRILNGSYLTTPDGMPTVWIGRARGHKEMRRVYGPDLMADVCRQSVERGWTHFLYGGNPGVAEELKARLEARYPGIRIVGTYTPPFRPLTPEETADLTGRLDVARPDLMWVGLSTPKQEQFMAESIARLPVTLMIGVGAAFDVLTGRIKDAPRWMKLAGLQWLHRLMQEPRRLWRRYLVIVPAFLWRLLLDRIGVRR